MKKQWQLVMTAFVLLASLMMSSFPLAQTALAQGTVRQIALKGSLAYPNAKGVAKYQVDGSEREFEIEIQGIRALAGQRLAVYVNGVRVGSFLVNSLGAGKMVHTTLKGQIVPWIVTGSKVRIRTGTGALVAYGQF
jgi:hypothetical protein